MKTAEDLRGQWNNENSSPSAIFDNATFATFVRQRVRKESGKAFQYFWASFIMQLIVYALLAHVAIRYHNDPMVLVPALVNMLLYIPFTVVLMRRFKRMAILPGKAGTSVRHFVSMHREQLSGFYRFKRMYEYILIPLSTIIGTIIVFRIWVPGGVFAFPTGAIITIATTLASCIVAIRRENQRNFEQPLLQMDHLLNELGNGH